MIKLIGELLKEWTGQETQSSSEKSTSGLGNHFQRLIPEEIRLQVLERIRNFLGNQNPTILAWTSSILACLGLLFITGVGLWFFYSPSVTSAWESVYYIEEILPFGHWIRGIHYLTSDILIVLTIGLLIYLVTTRLCTKLFGVGFYLWLILLGLFLFNSLNGLLLPWDQQGYWSTRIRLDITSTLPVLGPIAAKILAGSDTLGHLSLTRSMVFHAGLVPLSIISLIGIQTLLNPFHSPTQKNRSNENIEICFKQCGFFIGLTVIAIVFSGFLHVWIGGEESWGAPHLKAPADPSSAYPIARPEWYFLWLFQMLKFFPGEWMIVGTAIIPGMLTGLIVFFPHIGRYKWGHRFNCCAGLLILCVIGGLTMKAALQDFWDEQYQSDFQRAKDNGKRTVELAQVNGGIPITGAQTLVKNDQMIQGAQVFAQHCASCHRYDGHDGLDQIPEDTPSAPDLYGFASIPWIAGILDPEKITSHYYFGGSEKLSGGKMAKYVKKDLSQLNEEDTLKLQEVVHALSNQAQLPYQDLSSNENQEKVENGVLHIEETFGCIDCHMFEIPDDEATAVDLTGYGSRDWIIRFISNPAHPSLYGDKNDRMPAFLDENILSMHEIELVTDWIRHDWIQAQSPDLSKISLRTVEKDSD